MDDYREAYYNLLKEFETYQSFAESQIQMLNEKNIKMEKSLDAFFNIIEVSKYINSYLSNENLIPMINDMILGVLVATYSSIYLKEDDILNVKASNCISSRLNILEDTFLRDIQNENPFVLNSVNPLFGFLKDRANICSLIGVPIKLRERFMGYIIVEHTHCNFFNNDHIKFIASIANQIGIAIENSILYKKITESAKKDPFLNIYHRKYIMDFIRNKINMDKNKSFAVVMIDLDDFKQLNDSYGHPFGDMVLVQTARLLERNIDKEDIVARYGGEELLLYIDNPISKDDIFSKINTIREKISKNKIHYRNITKTVTASFGISLFPEDGSTLQELLYLSDENLYKAKELGKNKVEINYIYN